MALRPLYHGTDINSARTIYEMQSADVHIGSKKVDFGPGFYMTEDIETAKQWAVRKAAVRNSKPAIITAMFDEDGAKNLIERFSDDIRWGRFVINNRNGLSYIDKVPFKDNNLDSRYPITYGRIADVEVRNIAGKLRKSGNMLDGIESILNINYSMQYAFHTEEAISYLVSYSYRNI
ncbi:MAG: DUF3990 domain-containing protein [Lachnospiraceae bacterium]|nr:DUF3990 domain-containing protein [Lachnospiraceae bacterium]